VIWLLAALTSAQEHRLPIADAHAQYFQVTNYMDHDGGDYECGDVMYPGHRGTDISGDWFGGMEDGRDIIASAAGVVETAVDGYFDECIYGGCEGAPFGNYVVVRHSDGWATLYAHLKKWSVVVSPGDWVACGEVLGEMGSSGNSLGPHLHYELRDDEDVRWDPFVGSCGGLGRWTDQGAYLGLPGMQCAPAIQDCAPEDVLTCGDVVVDDTALGTHVHGHYGCTEWSYDGPERVYTVITDRDEPFTITATGLTADLDLYVHGETSCDARSCLAHSAESSDSSEGVVFAASANVAYTVVLDGFKGATSPYRLTVACAGGLPPGEDTGDASLVDSSVPMVDTGHEDTSTPGQADTGEPPVEPDPNGGAGSSEPRVIRPGETCGCSGSGLAAAFLPLSGLLLTRRRRSRPWPSSSTPL